MWVTVGRIDSVALSVMAMGYRDAQLLFSDRKLSFALFRLSNDVTKRTVANQISAFFPSSSHPFISILFFDLSYFSGSSPFFSRLFQFIISCISVVMIFASKQKPSRFECLIFRTPQNRNHYKLGKKRATDILMPLQCEWDRFE